VVPESRHVAARALFYGLTQTQNLPPGAEWQLWTSCAAFPFTVSGLHGENLDPDERVYDTITPGVVTLNSTRYFERSKGMSDRTWENGRSVLSFVPSVIPDIWKLLADRMREIVSKTS